LLAVGVAPVGGHDGNVGARQRFQALDVAGKHNRVAGMVKGDAVPFDDEAEPAIAALVVFKIVVGGWDGGQAAAPSWMERSWAARFGVPARWLLRRGRCATSR